MLPYYFKYNKPIFSIPGENPEFGMIIISGLSVSSGSGNKQLHL
jgi:hypothetical protein